MEEQNWNEIIKLSKTDTDNGGLVFVYQADRMNNLKDGEGVALFTNKMTGEDIVASVTLLIKELANNCRNDDQRKSFQRLLHGLIHEDFLFNGEEI